MLRESMLWPSITVEAVTTASRCRLAYKTAPIARQTTRRLVRTSHARDCTSARTLTIRPAMVAKAARDSRENCMREEGAGIVRHRPIVEGLLRGRRWWWKTAAPAAATDSPKFHCGASFPVQICTIVSGTIVCIVAA
jgi:hypothetical protein